MVMEDDLKISAFKYQRRGFVGRADPAVCCHSREGSLKTAKPGAKNPANWKAHGLRGPGRYGQPSRCCAATITEDE